MTNRAMKARLGAGLAFKWAGKKIRHLDLNGVALKFVEAGGKAPALLVVDSDTVQKKKAEVAKEGGVEAK